MDGPRSIHPGAVIVWRLAAAISALFAAAALMAAAAGLTAAGRRLPLPTPAIGGLVFVLLLAHGWWYARARFRSWRFEVGDASVVVQYGVLWRLRRSIPRARIQHVDVHSGPLDRLLGLAQLSLYTAGSMGPVATIPGLPPDEAATLRDRLVARDGP